MHNGRVFALPENSGLRLLAAALLLFLIVPPRRVHAQASAGLLLPAAIAYDAAGNLLIADAGRHQILEATLAGTLIVLAGTGTQGFSGDGGPAIAAELNSPGGIAVGSDGTIYVADTGNARVRAIRAGSITTLAGTGIIAFGGDGGLATAASFRSPTALAFDKAGALLVSDTADHRVRRIDSGIVTTLAGTGVQGFAGDGGTAAGAELDSPGGVAIAPDGRVFIADTHNERVRIVAVNGTISTFAGTGQRGFTGDGGPATAAALSGPRGLALNPAGALLIADADNQRVRLVDGQGVITTMVGRGTEGASGDAAVGVQAALHAPRAVAISPFGLPAVADVLNGTVRLFTSDGTLFRPAALAETRTASVVQESWAAPQTYGQVRLSVSVSGPVGMPHGAVTVSEGSTVLTSLLLAGGSPAGGALAGAIATANLPTFGAGAHALTVAYAGDGLNRAATAAASTLQVLPAPLTATAQSSTIAYGAPLPSLAGSVQGILAQDAGQVAVLFTTVATAQSPVGNYPITASALRGAKSGNYALSPASTPGSLQIVPAGTTTSLAGIAQSYVGLPLRLSANVAPATSGNPTGTVQFLDGAAVVAIGTLVNGSASAVYIAPPAGTSNLSARYGGDTNFTSSMSNVQSAQIAQLPDFSLSLSGSVTATVPAGNTATYTLLVSAQPAPFTGAVLLSATGLPHGAAASFSPVQVIPGASAAVVTMSVQTPAPQGLLHPAGQLRSTPVWACVALLTGGYLARKRRKLLWSLALSISVCGCGARTTGEGLGGLTTTSYPLVITGTSTNLLGSVMTHTVNLTLIVEQ